MLLGAASEDDPDLQPSHAGSPSEPHAVRKRLLDDVAESMVGVVSGVGRDQHVLQLVQPQQLGLDRRVSAVGVEGPFLTFDDVQSRAAQPAALQR